MNHPKKIKEYNPVPLLIALLFSFLFLFALVAVEYVHQVRMKSARAAFYAAKIGEFSRFEIIYTDPSGKVRMTRNQFEYFRALESFEK